MFTQKGDKVIFEAIITGIRALKDKSASITLATQEIPRGAGSLLFDLNQCFVQVMIKEADGGVEIDDLKDLDDFKAEKFDIPSDKSPSKRLRDVLFIRYKQLGEPGGDYDLWYLRRMEQYILHEKSKLKP